MISPYHALIVLAPHMKCPKETYRVANKYPFLLYGDFNEKSTEWPKNIHFIYLEDVYEESIVLVLETLSYDDNIGSKKLG